MGKNPAIVSGQCLDVEQKHDSIEKSLHRMKIDRDREKKYSSKKGKLETFASFERKHRAAKNQTKEYLNDLY